MLKNCKNSRVQGTIGLGEAIAWFTKNGYNVALPIAETQRYDLIVEKDNKLSRVEIKTSYSKAPSNNYVVSLRTSGGNRSGVDKYSFFSAIDTDLLFLVTNDGSKYLIPATEVNKRSVTLGDKHLKYKIV